jgi:hypothetical protein
MTSLAEQMHRLKVGKLHPMGIFSLNKSMNNLSTVHAISAQISSIGAACRTKFKQQNKNKITKNSL